MNRIIFCFLLVSLTLQAENIPSPSMTIKWAGFGDFRIRNESINQSLKSSIPGQDFSQSSNRNRMRLRLGLNIEINPRLKFQTRLATGGANALSSNQDFGGFQKYSADFDQAFLKYQLLDGASLYAGKMINYFSSTPLIWDTDVHPDGLGFEWKNENWVLRIAQWSTLVNSIQNQGVQALQGGIKTEWAEIYLANYLDNWQQPNNFYDLYLIFNMNPITLKLDGSYDDNMGSYGYWLSADIGKIKRAGDFSGWLGIAHYDYNFKPDFADSDFGGSPLEGFMGGLRYAFEDQLKLEISLYNRKDILSQMRFNNTLLDLNLSF